MDAARGCPACALAGDSESLGFVPIEGVREGRLHGEPLPMFLAIETIASALGI